MKNNYLIILIIFIGIVCFGGALWVAFCSPEINPNDTLLTFSFSGDVILEIDGNGRVVYRGNVLVISDKELAECVYSYFSAR